MTNRLFHYLVRPKALFNRILQKRAEFISRKNFNISALEDKQNGFFQSVGLSRSTGLGKKRMLESSLGIVDDSEHAVLFASISQSRSVHNILEIGTYNGRNARYLSLLFPNAEIETIDLPENDPMFIHSYNRSDPEFLSRFLTERSTNLAASERIKFTRLNSIGLINYPSKSFDLIWVDGAHGYPVVAIDIANAVRLLKKEGLMLCDDVWVGRNEKSSDFMYKSGATIEVLHALKEAHLIDFSTIYKRVDYESAGSPFLKEYIAVVRSLI